MTPRYTHCSLTAWRSGSWNKSTAGQKGLDVAAEQIDIRGQADNYFFWPSHAWAELGGSLALQVLDRSSMTLVQTFSHPCAQSEHSVSGSVLELHDGTAYLELAQSTVSYIYIKGQAHDCCVENRCLTLRPRAQAMGPTASGGSGAPATEFSIRPSCSTVKSTTSGTVGSRPAYTTSTSSVSRHTVDETSRQALTASAPGMSSTPSGGAGNGNGHISSAIDNAASGLQRKPFWTVLTLASLALLAL